MKYNKWEPETVVSWFVSKGEEKSKEKTRCACQHVGCSPSLNRYGKICGWIWYKLLAIPDLIWFWYNVRHKSPSLVQQRTELGVKKYWHLPKKVELCHIYAKDEGETIAKINLEIGEINRGMRTAKKTCCFCQNNCDISPPTKRSHWPLPCAWGKGMRKREATQSCN